LFPLNDVYVKNVQDLPYTIHCKNERHQDLTYALFMRLCQQTIGKLYALTAASANLSDLPSMNSSNLLTSPMLP
jgi:hypothetical protein